MTAVKICTDCVFFMDTGITKQYGKCGAKWKYSPTISHVTGIRDGGEHWFAATMRDHDCGSAGRYFKPKNPAKHIIATDKPKEKKVTWWDRLVSKFV